MAQINLKKNWSQNFLTLVKKKKKKKIVILQKMEFI